MTAVDIALPPGPAAPPAIRQAASIVALLLLMWLPLVALRDVRRLARATTRNYISAAGDSGDAGRSMSCAVRAWRESWSR